MQLLQKILNIFSGERKNFYRAFKLSCHDSEWEIHFISPWIPTHKSAPPPPSPPQTQLKQTFHETMFILLFIMPSVFFFNFIFENSDLNPLNGFHEALVVCNLYLLFKKTLLNSICYLGMELPCCRVCQCLTLPDSGKLFFKVIVQIYPPTSSMCLLEPTLGIIKLDFCQFKRKISHCIF